MNFLSIATDVFGAGIALVGFWQTGEIIYKRFFLKQKPIVITPAQMLTVGSLFGGWLIQIILELKTPPVNQIGFVFLFLLFVFLFFSSDGEKKFQSMKTALIAAVVFAISAQGLKNDIPALYFIYMIMQAFYLPLSIILTINSAWYQTGRKLREALDNFNDFFRNKR